MTSEEFRRIATLKSMEARIRTLRPQLVEIGHKDFFHITEIERLLTDMLAEPGSSFFGDRAFSLSWHLRFLWAEYAQLKGVSTEDPEGQLSLEEPNPEAEG